MPAIMQSPQSLLSNSLPVDPISSSNNCFSVRIRYPDAHLNASSSRKSIITCARSTNRGFFGSKQSRKTLIQLVRFAASNLHHVLPEPLNTVIREIGDGSGGGGGGWKGFGWGGFEGGGGGGRKRKVNKKSQFWLLGFAAVWGLGFWWLNLTGRLELRTDVMLGAMCLSMFLVLIRNGCVPEWVLGFCSGGVVVGLSLDKKNELQKFFRGFKKMGISRRHRGRRAV